MSSANEVEHGEAEASPSDEESPTDAASADPAAEGPADSPFLAPRWLRLTAVAVASVFVLWFWSGFQMEGHNGGDDFALYINQARSLLHGDVGETLANNRFTVENSAWHTFSPYAYPWGFPLLLAGVMALTGAVDSQTGIDYAPLKFVVSLSFLVALLAYSAMLRRRITPAGSVLLPIFFAANFLFVLHTDNVLSEFPFLMGLMLFVVLLDRCRERDLFLGPRSLPLVGLGLLACFAFNVRREGIGALAGLALAQLVVVWGASGSGPLRARIGEIRGIDWKPIATPWASFAAATVLFQILLPSDLTPRYVERDPTATAGLHRIVDNLEIYRPLLAEQLGLKDIGPNETTLFGSAGLGAAAFWGLIGFACLGIVLTAIRYPARDLPVVGVFLGVAFVVLISPFQTYRYIMALVPFLMYFAYQGLAQSIRLLPRPELIRLVVVADLLVIAFVLGGWPDTSNARDYRTNWTGPQPGPQQPHSLEMYAAIKDETRGDAIIIANRARLMTLYTGRRALQGGAITFVESAGDYYAMYLEPDGSPGDYSQYPLTDDEAEARGFVEVWRNPGWVIWRIPPHDQAVEP